MIILISMVHGDYGHIQSFDLQVVIVMIFHEHEKQSVLFTTTRIRLVYCCKYSSPHHATCGGPDLNVRVEVCDSVDMMR